MTHLLTVPHLDVNYANLEQLRKYAEELRFKLEELLPPDWHIITLQKHFKLTRQQAIILAALGNGRYWTFDQLLAVAAKWKLDVGRSIVTVQIFHIRQKLPRSIVISSEFGIGYKITQGLDELQNILNQKDVF